MSRRRSPKLDASELADAGLTAALVFSLTVTGRLLAFGMFFQVLSAVVIAGLAARRRFRVTAIATVSSAILSLMAGGVSPILQTFSAGVFGWTGGVALGRGWGRWRSIAWSVLIGWPAVSAFGLGFFALFNELRELSLTNIGNQWTGFSKVLNFLKLGVIVDVITPVVEWIIKYWYLAIPLSQLVVTVLYAFIVRRVGGAIVSRLNASLGDAHVEPAPTTAETPDPVPVELVNAVVDRPGSGRIIDGLTATIAPGSFTALVGGNGAGKSTLLEAIAGLRPSTGISHPGPVGLGRPGGTAWIGQRPEAQVIGARVVDDVRWGAPNADVAEVLHHVGLDGFELRSTSKLSGGELQRLALAAALARTPRLVLSDESTAMLDPVGRAEVTEQLRARAREGVAIIHSTHHESEISGADRTIELSAHETLDDPAPRQARRTSRIALTADHVSFVHNPDSPWEHKALDDVSIEIRRGELLMIVGANGSGKTTLARLMTGLARPTSGVITVDRKPLEHPTEKIALAVQHPRLQLLRATIGAEVKSLAGHEEINGALELVGLPAAQFAHRRVDAVSGGEQRRIVLAGLVARQPDLLVLDEPLAGLDVAGRNRLAIIADRLTSRGTAVVVISHDPSWGEGRVDRIVHLDDGRLVADSGVKR